MTPDERNMLTDLANKIAQTPAPPRDPEAEEFIRTRIGNRPDALYLMTQTVLIQNMALEQAQRQIQELQQRAASSSESGSFLGQSGSRPSYPNPGPAAGYAPPSGYAQQQTYAPPPPQYAAPQPSAPPSGGGSGFLRGAAQTAAGVAAGALAFEGIRGLFNAFEHPSYGSGFGGFGGGGFGERPVEETVINNYYDSPSEHGQGDRISDDIEDERHFSGQNNDVYDDDADSLADSDLADSDQFDDSGDYNDYDDSGDSFA